MAPRRHRSISNVQNATVAPPPPQRTLTPSASSQRQFGMSLAVYQSNMKVMMRREPSITAIVDQFSHVCLYRYVAGKWEKHGYEGSMFLFEKSTYPTYGFYILNRMGTEDYVRPIYPEDDMDISGDYLMCRVYPDFTQTRLEMGLPYPIPPESREAFDHELSKRLPPDYQEKDKDKEKKGRSTILGLWMFPTDAREPLKLVMKRLHSYILQGLPYPDEFRYAPGRPPTSNSHLRTASRSSVHAPPERVHSTRPVPPASDLPPQSVSPPSAPAGASSGEIDALFARLLPTTTPGPAPAPVQVPVPVVSTPPVTMPPIQHAPAPPATQLAAPPKSVFDLLASLNGTDPAAPSPHPQHVPTSFSTMTVPSTATGPTAAARSLLDMMFASASETPIESTPILPSRPEEIVIVSPKPTSTALPVVLTQDVISTLMGLAPDSRASSAAPSSAGSRRSAQRYEGDNEFSETDLASEGELPQLSTARASIASRSIPTFSVPRGPSSESEPEAIGKTNGHRRIPGDVTPRPPAGGMRLPPTSPPQFQQRTETPVTNGKTNGHASPAPVASAAPRSRPLVPFEANSDLWPYPRAPLDDRSFEQDDVVELDYTDTRALSDPAIFSSRLKEKKSRKEKGRKGKKEREQDKEREKAEIEKGWDLPTRTQGQPSYQPSASGPVAEAATVRTETPASTTKAHKVVSTAGRTQDGALDGSAAKDALLAAMFASARQQSGPQIEKNEFIRELLTLIHTDTQFVDCLWKDYLKRCT